VRRDTDIDIVALVVGTDADPQGLDSQVEQLRTAGATVYTTTAEAAAHITRRLPRPAASPPLAPIDLAAFSSPLAALNVGLESFYDSLIDQSASAVHVEWRPPAGGDERLIALLAKMRYA
jgi:FdrA protein